MGAQRGSSFLFSLKGLLDGEKERVQAEEAQKLQQAERVRQRTRERERFAREMLEKKRLAEAEIQRLEQQRQREDAARAEALRLATLERARLEAESRAQLEILETQQEHERKLCAIREASRQKGSTQLAIAGFALAGLVSIGFSGLYFGKLRPESQRLSGAYDDLVSAERTRALETEKLLARADERNDHLHKELRAARRRIEALEARTALAAQSPSMSTRAAPAAPAAKPKP